MSDQRLTIDTETLTKERDRLRAALRDIETENRKVEAVLKGLRQNEIATKRAIEALTTLLEVDDREEEQTKAAEAASDT